MLGHVDLPNKGVVLWVFLRQDIALLIDESH
jgi:hypothetical protein